MDQQLKVQMLPNRAFVERIAAILMSTTYSRAWTEEFEDGRKISALEGFVLEPGRIVLDAGRRGMYQSQVYKEDKTVLQALLLADVTGKVDFYVSNDGGRTWLPAKPGQTVHFSKKDGRLAVRAEAQGPAVIDNIGLIW